MNTAVPGRSDTNPSSSCLACLAEISIEALASAATIRGLSAPPIEAALIAAGAVIAPALIPIVLGLERAGLGDADVARLLVAELGQLHPVLGEMQRCHLLIQVLGQHIDLALVVLVVLPQLDL